MATKIQVYRLAATAVGASSNITSPDDDRPVAKAISAVWDLQRRKAIRDGSWNFAMTRDSLPALDAAPKHTYAYAYQEPAGLVRLIEVYGLARSDYQRESKKILCNQAAPLDIRYLRDVTEPAEWDDDFAEAFALRIACKIGRKIAGSAFDREATWKDYQDAIDATKAVDAMENPPIEQEEADWITARWHGPIERTMGTWEDGGA